MTVRKNTASPAEAAQSKKETGRFLQQQKSAAGRFLSLAITTGMANGLLLIAQAWVLSRIIDQAVFDHVTLDHLWPQLFILPAIFVCRAFLVWLAEILAFSAAANVKKSLRRVLYDRFQALGPKALATEETGILITSWTDGVDAMQDYYARYFPAMALTVMLPLAILVFVLPLDWLSGGIMLVTAPLIPFFMILIGKGTEKLNQKQWRKLAFLSHYFLDLIQGMTTLKLFNASRREARMVRQVSEEYRLETMKVLRIAFLSSLTLEFFATVSIALIAVTIGFRLMWGEMDFRHAFFVLLLAPEFYLPLRRMGVHYHARLQAIGAAENMVRLLSLALPVPHAGDRLVYSGEQAPTIIFRDVCFAYDGKTILKNASFEIPAGKATGLIGETGCGKSTVMALLLGLLQPQQGDILIDNIPLSQIDLSSFHRHLGWVPQSPILLQASIRDNILLPHSLCPALLSEMDFQDLCHDLHIDSFVTDLPHGYDTMLGEKGLDLSGGQTQRVALARALARQSPLLLLDEPTASLDAETEQAIDYTLKLRGHDKTRFVIAHRARSIAAMDIVYRLENGIVTQVSP